MKRYLFCLIVLAATVLTGCDDRKLKKEIQSDARFDIASDLAYDVLRTGFSAGDVYGAVWIRDFNTFIKYAMDVTPAEDIKEALNLFMCFQGADGNIQDGYVTPETAKLPQHPDYTYDYLYSEYAPGYGAHKNDVETDQETSFVQAVAKYVLKSGDYAYLQEEVAGATVESRLEAALTFLRDYKSSPEYGGLITGATTCDWGDVQPEHIWGVFIDENTHFAIDAYDNAMYVLAIKDFISIISDEAKKEYWTAQYENIIARTREYLWDSEKGKFRPHVYLAGSPFPEDFNEDEIFYNGGTGIAALAGILTPEEIKVSFEKMLEIKKLTGARTICVTAYPPYPEGFFKNGMLYPHGYQNGGDWPWYGVRIFWAMIDCGLVREAYTEFGPVLDRVIEKQDFNEWYGVPSGEPMGSTTYRGEAGVVLETISRLRAWASAD